MISIRTRKNPPDLEQTISDAPRNSRGRMTKAAAVYLVGNGSRGLKHYAAYRYVTRRRAYGKPFVSDKQRRFVMAAIREGRIDPGVPRRTGKLQRGWMVIPDGVKTRIVNNEGYADVVMGQGQSRHEKLAGWRQYHLIVESNTDGMVQAANQELVRYFKEKGVAVK